ncbi:hypothetical protein [uncultured Brevundimonas sp.]|mgnify:CR=1 FL=1|uniref:hypothetical protein n=1 Tax=uncultured Brevundimonas sp. TaxID=213418 RepID=UPI0025EB5968|nr:hypothetical protein [uncultured Brevundimonas sp.]
MWTDIKTSYGFGWGFAVVFPLVFLIAPVVEFVQHVIEWRIGLFDSLEQAEALTGHPARIAFGYVKLAALMIGGLWISRYLHSGGDRLRTASISGASVAAFIPVIIVFLALDFGLDQLNPWLDEGSLGKAGSIMAGLATFLLASVLQVLLAGWRVGVALDDRATGPLTSIRRGFGILLPGLTIYFGVFLPLLVAHTALNVGMVLAGPGVVLWGLFAIDSLLVGFIVTALWGSFYAIYRRGSEKAGLPPFPL